jgi:hypothetical protein
VLKFTQGTGNSADLAHLDFIVLEVPNITGNGQVETAVLAAGAPNFCKKLGDNINMTPSSNPSNGPRAAGDGVNTRFIGPANDRANGYGNQLKDTTRFPPDLNIRENITYKDYIDRTAVTLPDPNNPSYGQDERRVIVAPIIEPGSYPAYTTNIIDWGIFFLKRQSPTSNGQCDPAAGCGSLQVEYVGKANIGSANGPTSIHTSLTVPVLYR